MDDKKDFNSFVDGIVGAAKNITESFIKKGGEFAVDSGLKDLKDYYPFYTWPPLNLYTNDNESLVFEFGLPGFVKDDINISFKDDYMIFYATFSNLNNEDLIINSFKKKLGLRDISEQKYFVPEHKFDRENYIIHMSNGLLRIVFPIKEI